MNVMNRQLSPAPRPVRLVARVALCAALLVPLAVQAQETASAPPASESAVDLAKALVERALAMQAEGDHLAAVAFFDRALKEMDHPKLRYFRARSLWALGRNDEARREMAAVQIDPRMEPYAADIAIAIAQLDAQLGAAGSGGSAVAVDPTTPAPVYTGSGSLGSAERLARTAADARRAAASAPVVVVAPQPYGVPRGAVLPSEMRPRRGLMISGWVVFGVSYLLSVIPPVVILADGGEEPAFNWMLLPALGPFITAGVEEDVWDFVVPGVMLVLTGVTQLAGLAMGIAGTVMYQDDVERIRAIQATGGLPVGGGFTIGAGVIPGEARGSFAPSLQLGLVFD